MLCSLVCKTMKTFKQISIHLFILSFIVLPVFVYAGPTPPAPTPSAPTTIKIGIQNPFNCGGQPDCTIMTLIVAILEKIVMPIAAVGVVMWIVYAGFTFVTAQGVPKKIEEAKQRLLWSLVGAGILLGAVAISKVVESTVGALIAP
ncbi:MAG: hypothetical protein UU06_C0019G0006 [Parcubacteria group bacterium GW2011_GWB1_40_5]|nr:MAG: hypothetical protein UU06_C0019G0006 [Parcubacteria group bacterium GW2011_GWB1_40_5]